ncbi:MAG: type I DNA topoisomerase [Saprospiraceae bacterium]|nr:type I DNA topoisomerase [Saprospiraceae bacterium]
MPKNLLIVESPAKAKTIEKILGKDYTVKSSYGHVRDLERKSDAVDVENHFNPRYVVTPEKKKVVKELKDWVKKVDEVWLATDEDREGEAISWHLCSVLGLDPAETKRIVFREITAPAIKKAIADPRTVDIDLVNAQQARRILDRLVGYELSGILWRKVKGKLSAGRVQSVAVKLIVERERQIIDFESKPFFKVSAIFNVKDEKGKVVALKAELTDKQESEQNANDFLKQANGASFSINSIEVKPTKRTPAAPFTTSTLQQEASRKLGFGVKRTMTIAQRLYESGHITYMRTDSTNLSEVAISKIADTIKKDFGEKYLQTRRYTKKKSDSAQEAHEAIRPSYIENKIISGDRDQERLYELIWKRTIASQMANAQLEKTVVNIGISTMPDRRMTATGEVLKFDGFLKVYLESKDDDDENEESSGMLPPLHKGQELDLNEMTATERFTRPPARFTEAGLVKKLEELGIGRPSTYAPTISKIMEPDRGYVTKESREGIERTYQVITLKDGAIQALKETEITGTTKNRLYPTDVGMIVTDFLDEHFDKVMDYGFTAGIEKQFDHISEGKFEWTKMLEDFYGPFHETVEETLENAKRSRGERILGKDEATGHSIVAKISKYGRPMIQIGSMEEVGEEGKPQFANLKVGQTIASITLEEAKELFKLPKKLGEYDGKEVVVNTGRYGPYVKWGEDFISLGRQTDPFEIDFDHAKEVIEAKKKADEPIGTYKGIPYTQGEGRFGPFLKYDKLYVNIPKRYDPEQLTTDEAHELIEAKVQKEANRYIHRWDEDLLSVENGRWGPYIKYKKKNFKIVKKEDGSKYEPEEVKELTKEQVLQMIEEQAPGTVKKKAAKKKATKKKTSTTKDK